MGLRHFEPHSFKKKQNLMTLDSVGFPLPETCPERPAPNGGALADLLLDELCVAKDPSISWHRQAA